VIITCGPASALVDEVRRLTNHSTGTLGLQLTRAFAQHGFQVLCCRSQDCLVPERDFLAVAGEVKIYPFRTNEDLQLSLMEISRNFSIHGLFHAAALCDFSVVGLTDHQGNSMQQTKLSSREGDFFLRLRPAPKLIRSFREWFPRSRIIGWKYELEGTLKDVIARGQQQIKESQTDGCVLNGRAYGPGFGFLREGYELVSCKDGESLADYLASWLKNETYCQV